MPSISSLFGAAAANDSAQQLFVWGVLYGLLSAVFEPETTAITQEMWEAAVAANLHRALSPDELATQVVRGWRDEAGGEAEAAKAGVNQGDFASMVNNRRNPIAPEEAATALRRQIIPETAPAGQISFENAIQEGNLGNQWGTVIKQLATQIPSPADILQAALEGQIPTGTDPRALYTQVGGQETDPNTGFDWYTLMFNTRGSAPSPNEAAVMANRQIIPWDGAGPGVTSFEQAFLEGPWRNKWESAWRAMSQYLPPPRTVTAMLKQGALTTAQAIDLLTKQGLTPELVQAYITGATTTKTTKPKEISESQILGLLTDKLIDIPTAVTMLEQLGYPTNEANILASTAQAGRTIAELKKNVNRVETAYLAHKIDRANALTLLAQLGLDSAAATAQVNGWDIDKQANVKVLSVAQIESAWEIGVYTQDQAQSELEHLGYTPYDAWTLLSIKAKQPLPNPPPFGPGLVA